MVRKKGFTLIEAMVIIASLGLIAAVVRATYQKAFSEVPPHNAAKDIAEEIEKGRVVAAKNGSDVWFVFYPAFNHRGNTSNAGRGAVFIFEDTRHDFNAETGTAPNLYYRENVGKAFDPIADATTGPNGKLIDTIFIEDYGDKLRVRLPRGKIDMGLDEGAFKGLNITKSCSFCTPGGRGAIKVSADKSIQFFDGDGVAVDASTPQTLTIISDGTKRTSIVGIAGGVVSAFKK